MADVAMTTANVFRVLESTKQISAVAGEDLAAGDAVRYVPSSTGAGKVVKAQGDTAGNGRVIGIAARTAKSGYPVTVIMEGVVDGYALGDLNYGVDVWLSAATAGALATAAPATTGNAVVVVGKVHAVPQAGKAATYDKVLIVNIGAISVVA